MSYCINPNCLKPQNTGESKLCLGCGSELRLQGCYQVTRLLSNPNKPSGFGTIYEVNHNGLLKILKVLHNQHPKAIVLFRQEAQVLQRLNHSGIPKVEKDGYFVCTFRDNSAFHCLVMEKIEGMNLEEWLEERNNEPIVESVTINWLKQLVEILHEVHQQQYFHRDIKPANIMLRPNGKLALIDFGTAREVTQTFMQKIAGQQITGIVSVGYTPLEQSNGKAVPQSDFFALGRTFVYLLTGKHPSVFPNDSYTGELIWRDNAILISRALADLIDDLMKSFPGNRPQNTQEILQRLDEIEKNIHLSSSTTQLTDSTTVISPKKLPDKYKMFLAGGVILILGSTSLYYAFHHSSPLSSHCTYVVADPDDPSLNVRVGPGTNEKIIHQLKNGTSLSVVTVVDGDKGWLEIDSPVKGWVAGNRTKKTCNP
ncbi:MAG: serine/threonine protein kinase [Rhizonema sp. NSF051]|nr:serine/threonine protein kinase [Rhizonema sp. NSF051]